MMMMMVTMIKIPYTTTATRSTGFAISATSTITTLAVVTNDVTDDVRSEVPR